MKSKIFGVLSLLATYNNVFSKDGEFEKFFLTNFKKFEAPFNLKDHLKKCLSKDYSESDFLQIDKDLFISMYIKQNDKKKIEKSVYIRSKILPIFYLEHKNSVILCYDKIEMDHYGVSDYQCWLKSFTRAGESIDSLKIGHFANYEDITVRSFSIIHDIQHIMLKYFERDVELNKDNTPLTESFSVSGLFQITESGLFHIANEDNNSIVFKTDYGYYSLKEVFNTFHNGCMEAKSFLRGDFNGDHKIDLIYLTFDRCKNIYSDLILSLGDYQGLFSYGGTLGGINLDSRLYSLSLVQIKDEILSIELKKIGQLKEVKLSFSFNKKKRLCNLKFVDVVNSNSDKRISPPNSNNYLAQGILFGKTILDEP